MGSFPTFAQKTPRGHPVIFGNINDAENRVVYRLLVDPAIEFARVGVDLIRREP